MLKKIVVTVCVVLLVSGGLGYVFRDSLWQGVQGVITQDMFIAADTGDYSPGVEIGQPFPAIRARYQGQEVTSIDQFVQDKGMIFITNRSASWWPYCMVQFVQLQDYSQAFSAAGIGIVALTYDESSLQEAFINKNSITYPFLSDIDAQTVKALGILNEDYEPGDRAYGIPHPGIFILDSQANIVGKIFVDGYEKRVNAESVLAIAKKLLN